jgi:hypothetical protein
VILLVGLRLNPEIGGILFPLQSLERHGVDPGVQGDSQSLRSDVDGLAFGTQRVREDLDGVSEYVSLMIDQQQV